MLHDPPTIADRQHAVTSLQVALQLSCTIHSRPEELGASVIKLDLDLCAAAPMHAPETLVMPEQDSLTDELLGMSAALKRNALAMQQGVANRGAILEETDDSIERNLAMQQQSVKKSKEEYRR